MNSRTNRNCFGALLILISLAFAQGAFAYAYSSTEKRGYGLNSPSATKQVQALKSFFDRHSGVQISITDFEKFQERGVFPLFGEIYRMTLREVTLEVSAKVRTKNGTLDYPKDFGGYGKYEWPKVYSSEMKIKSNIKSNEEEWMGERQIYFDSIPFLAEGEGVLSAIGLGALFGKEDLGALMAERVVALFKELENVGRLEDVKGNIFFDTTLQRKERTSEWADVSFYSGLGRGVSKNISCNFGVALYQNNMASSYKGEKKFYIFPSHSGGKRLFLGKIELTFFACKIGGAACKGPTKSGIAGAIQSYWKKNLPTGAA